MKIEINYLKTLKLSRIIPPIHNDIPLHILNYKPYFNRNLKIHFVNQIYSNILHIFKNSTKLNYLFSFYCH